MFYKLVFIVMFVLSLSSQASILNDIKSFDANFEQKIINPSQKEILYKGHLVLKEPYYILWQYKEPIIKNVYIINNFAVIDEPELEQAILTELQHEIDIISLIKNAKEVSKNKYVANIYDVEYNLFTKDNFIQKIEYKDALENSVVITFSNIKQNIEVDEEIFKFLPPEEYDIIRK
ncbi:LolA-like outer membrane lipoprotein chaperone [Arcobacter sp.]|uniref:LolA-like outer membrane lipoprotein chaperone n=1 Tax=Arcobacter sp. TaxID=1872629 RepID=UPI003D0C9F91